MDVLGQDSAQPMESGSVRGLVWVMDSELGAMMALLTESMMKAKHSGLVLVQVLAWA